MFGAITVSYNLVGVEKGLKLDGATVGDIFLGKIKKWNDPAIAKLNPGVKLPGTTSRSSTAPTSRARPSCSRPSWPTTARSGRTVGADKTVKWPTGTGAKGNDGVAGCVKQTDGAVGYVEQAYALQNNFTTADVKNKSGKYIAPTLESTSAAGDGLKVPADLRFSAINSPNPTAYPIASATFILVYKDMCKAGKSKDTAQRVKDWLDYALGDGQSVAPRSSSTRRCRRSIHTQAQAKVNGLTVQRHRL